MCLVLQKGINVITTPIFTRLLGAENYGEFNLFISWQTMISVFATMNLTAGVYTQGLVKFEDRRYEFSAAMQGLSLCWITMFFGIYLAGRNFFNALFSLNSYEMIAMFVMMWTYGIFGFWSAEQRVDYAYRTLVVVTIIVSLAKPLAGIYAVRHFEDQVTARIVSMALVQLIFFTPLIAGKFKLHKPFFSKAIWKYAILFNLPLIPHYISQTVLNKADILMIGKYVGADKAGIYSLAYSLAMLLLIVNTAMIQTLTPWIYRKIRDREIDDIAHIAYMAMIFIAFLNILLIAFAPEIIRIFAPPEFKEAIWVIPPIAMSGLFIFSYDLFSAYQFYFEKTFFVMIASIVGAAVNVVLNYIFIPKFGYVAAGYTTLVCYILYAVGHYLFMNRVCRVEFKDQKPYNIRILLKIYGCFIGTGIGIMMTYKAFLVRLALIGLLGILSILKREKLMEFIKKMRSMGKK